ncbi:MAG: radical SAM protein [Candidatus Bathyarchaeia archaeon]
MLVREKRAKTILSESKVHEYTINPYVGCEHGCTYCYARFIRRFTGHREAWGDFVDVKVNAIGLLEREVGRKRIGRVWILDLLRAFKGLEVVFTVTTADDGIRKIFEPKAPSIEDRIRALERLSSEGIGTCAMIAPILPGAEGLPKLLRGIVRSVLIDRMNYHYADWVYRRHGLEYAMKDVFFSEMGGALAKAFRGIGIPCEILF